MEIKLVNRKTEDVLYLTGENVEELRNMAAKEMEKRDWKEEDCYLFPA